MKKDASLALLRRLFLAAGLTVACASLAFLAYLHLAFTGPLTGDVRAEPSSELLTSLQVQRFQAVVGRFERRTSQPEPPEGLPDPFDATR